MSGLRILVVDDEPLAREMVAALAADDEDVADVHQCGTAADALAFSARLAPDILLLDVEMPEMDGISLAERLSERGPVVVFVTAHRRYAADAFAVGAIEYLLKPFSDARFREALGRAKRRVAERRLAAQAAGLNTRPAVAGALEFGDLVIHFEDIVWIEAQDYYVRVHTAHARHLVRATLASLEERLDPDMFLRVHRAAIVSIAAVRGHLEQDGSLRLALADGSHVPVSRAKRREVQEKLPRL